MIDEDLYQQAADELNTDKRRPHIWARACALASDDHDEARYLYTNLRVEELIAERETSGESSSPAAAADGDSADASLALEPLDFDEDSPQSVSTPSGIDQNPSPEVSALTLNSASSGDQDEFESVQSRNFQDSFDNKASSDDQASLDELSLHDDFLDETINLTSELDGTAVFELDKADAPDIDDTLDNDGDAEKPAEISADEELEALLGGVYEGGAPVKTDIDDSEAVMTADFSDVSGAHKALDDDLAWLEDDQPTLGDGTDNRDPLQEDSDDEDDTDDDSLTLSDFEDTEGLVKELEEKAEAILGETHAPLSTTDQTDTQGSEEDQLSLVLDAEGSVSDSKSVAADKTDAAVAHDDSGLDSIFDSIENEADEALTRVAAREQTEEADARATDVEQDQPADSATEFDDIDEQIDEHASGTADHSEDRLSAAAMTAAAGTAVAGMAGAGSAIKSPDISAVSARPAGSSSVASAQTLELPLDLTAARSSGTRYSVFRRDTQAQAVKQGASWTALFLTLPFLIYRHLFGTALVYAILWLILAGGLLISGLAWLDAGSAASLAVKASTVGFAVLAVIGLLYLPFRHANQWREDKLEQRGFERIALVRDSSPGKAISQARSAAGLD